MVSIKQLFNPHKSGQFRLHGFSTGIGDANMYQPIGTDGTNIYLCSNVAVNKLNASLLLDEFIIMAMMAAQQ